MKLTGVLFTHGFLIADRYKNQVLGQANFRLYLQEKHRSSDARPTFGNDGSGSLSG